MSSDSLIAEIFDDLFNKEEWDLWVKGEFNLCDNYVKRVGMSEEDAERLRNGKPLEKPLTSLKDCRRLKYEKNNT